jgi:mediator of RNA polymerase II transcription subunit 5
LGNYIWESSEADLLLLLKVLHALVKPHSISGEAQACHRTVLNITARTLEEQLKDVRTRLPGGRSDHQSDIQPSPHQDIQQEIQSLLDILDPYLSFQCNGNSRRSELDSWTTHADGICGVIRVTFQGLILWSASAEMSMSPHAYTHRLILAGIRLSTASNVLSVLIDELKAQAEEAGGSLDLAIDIAATLICAPIPESFAQEQTIYHPIDTTKEAFPRCLLLTLRQALMVQHQNVPKLSEKDPTRAEVIVRLTRRVNALLTPPAHVGALDVTNIIDNMNLEAAAAAAAAGHDVIDLSNANGAAGDQGAGAPGESIDQILNNVVAATANNDHHGTGNEPHDLDTTGMDTSLDDILNAAHMGNPEFLDLDMDGMF